MQTSFPTVKFVTLLSLMLFSQLSPAANRSESFSTALAGAHREDLNRARDVYRHPQQTLEFLGLKPGMSVVEIWPAKGWYTEILAPLTRGNSSYYAAGFSMTADRTPQWRKNMHTEFTHKLAATPGVYDHVVVTELSVPERTTIAPPASVDLVLTFRNVHNWMKGDYAEPMFLVFNRALKPGGLLGIVEHRARPGTSLEAMIKSGYVTEQHVIKLAKDAGFELLAKSEVNANPLDTKDHPAGVWSLPPSQRLCKKIEKPEEAESCEKKYRAIGESDRMTLRFRKK